MQSVSTFFYEDLEERNDGFVVGIFLHCFSRSSKEWIPSIEPGLPGKRDFSREERDRWTIRGS